MTITVFPEDWPDVLRALFSGCTALAGRVLARLAPRPGRARDGPGRSAREESEARAVSRLKRPAGPMLAWPRRAARGRPAVRTAPRRRGRPPRPAPPSAARLSGVGPPAAPRRPSRPARRGAARPAARRAGPRPPRRRPAAHGAGAERPAMTRTSGCSSRTPSEDPTATAAAAASQAPADSARPTASQTSPVPARFQRR